MIPIGSSAHPAAWYGQSQPSFLGGNEARLLRGGDELFPALIAAIDAALHEVWLATYIFHDDEAAHRVALCLVRAARRGVRVRLVVDGFGSHKAMPHLQRWLAGSGVSMAVFRPLERWWNWLQPGQLRRLHQKLCVVDGTQGFVVTRRAWTTRWRFAARWSRPSSRLFARCGHELPSATTGGPR